MRASLIASLTLAVPLAPNINDKGCAFGGSLTSLMTLASWGVVELALARAVGAEGERADSKENFARALDMAVKSDKTFVIDAMLEKEDISPTLRRLTDHFSKKVKAAL